MKSSLQVPGAAGCGLRHQQHDAWHGVAWITLCDSHLTLVNVAHFSPCFVFVFFSSHEYNTHIYARRLVPWLSAPYAAMSVRGSTTVWDGVTKTRSVCSESWRKMSPVERLDSLACLFFFFNITLVEHSGTEETDVGHRVVKKKNSKKRLCAFGAG